MSAEHEIAELRAENQALRTQVAQLLEQVTTLRQGLEQAQSRIAEMEAKKTPPPSLVKANVPALEQRSADPATVWTCLTSAHWYGRQPREVEVVSETAVWYHTGLPPVPIRWVLIRDPLGEFPTQALRCSELAATPEQMLAWFVHRWQLEMPFPALRAHLGRETQRQWTPLAIARTTPALLGLFSLVTLLAHPTLSAPGTPVPHTAWYLKPLPTFADALAMVRRRLWAALLFPMSPWTPDPQQIPRTLLDYLCDLLCYAA